MQLCCSQIFYLSISDIEKAEKLLVDGVKHNTKNIPLRIMLTQLLVRNKKNDEAELYLKEAVSIDPDKYSLRVALSTFYSTSNQLDKAEEVLRDAIELDKEDYKRYLILVEFLSNMVGVKEAEAELRKNIDEHPDLYDLRFSLAGFYEKLKKVNDSKEIYTKIIEEKSYSAEGTRARVKLAEILFGESNIVESRKYVNEVLDEYPTNNDALVLKARLSLIDFDYVTAINALRTVVKNSPRNVDAALLLSRAHEMNNENDLAENQLKLSIAADPSNFKSHLNYINYLIQKNRINEAGKLAEKALIHFDNNYQLQDLNFRIAVSNKDEDRILKVLEMMLRTSPEKSDVYFKKAQYALFKQNYDAALIAFNDALVRTNNKYPVLKEIVKVYVMQNKLKDAKSYLTKRFETNGEGPFLNQLLGEISLYEKNLVDARKYFEKVISELKEWPVPYFSLANTYLIEKDTVSAVKVYKRAVENVSNKSQVYIRMASLYEKEKKYTEAIETYETMLDIDPGSKIVANNLASLLLDHGKDVDFERVLKMVKGFENSNQPALMDTLAWTYSKSGDHPKAIKILMSIIKQESDVAVYQYHLGSALINNGEKNKARPYLEMAVESKQDFYGKDEAKKLLGSF